MLLEGRFHEGDKKSQVWLDRQAHKIMASCASLEAALSANGKVHLVGESFSLADIAVVGGLLYVDFRFPQLGWRSAHPVLSHYVDLHAQRESFKATVPPQ